MADSVYDQSLDLIATQVKTLADAVDESLIPENALTPRRFDWDDIADHPGISLRFVDDPASYSNDTQDTNLASHVGYPAIIVAHFGSGMHRDNRTKYIHSFLESVRAYYHHKRTLASVSVTGVRENTTTVRNGGPEAPRDFRGRGPVEMLTIMCWFMEPRA